MKHAALVEALLGADEGASANAAYTLRGLRFDLDLLVPLLDDPAVERQLRAVELLSCKHVRRAVELLVPMFGSAHERVVRKTAIALGKLGHLAPELLHAVLEAAPSDAKRLDILDALSRFQDAQARELLILHFDAWNPDDRARALAYLRRYTREPALATIRAALCDRETAHLAAKMAQATRDSSLVEPLVDALLAAAHGLEIDHLSRVLRAFGAGALDVLLARADPTHAPRIAMAISWLAYDFDEPTFWRVWAYEGPIRDTLLAHLDTRTYDRERCLAAIAPYLDHPTPYLRTYAQRARERLANGGA